MVAQICRCALRLPMVDQRCRPVASLALRPLMVATTCRCRRKVVVVARLVSEVGGSAGQRPHPRGGPHEEVVLVLVSVLLWLW